MRCLSGTASCQGVFSFIDVRTDRAIPPCDPVDPTWVLETGRAIVIPATRVQTDMILSEARRREQAWSLLLGAPFAGGRREGLYDL